MQERELVLPHLDAETCMANRLKAARDGCRTESRRRHRHAPLRSAALLRRHGQAPLPTTSNGFAAKATLSPASISSSYTAGLNEKLKGTNHLRDSGTVRSADYATHGGSFPLRVAGAGIVGSVTVSGLPMRQDHELVIEALCAVLGRNYDDLKLPPE